MSLLITTPYFQVSSGSSAIFVSGSNSGGTVTLIEKFNFSTESIEPGTSLTYARDSAAGGGEATFGLLACGYASPYPPGSIYGYQDTTEKYTYSNDSIVAGTNLGISRNQLGGFSNNTDSYFIGGKDAYSTSYNNGFKYAHSNDVVTAMSATLTNARSVGGAFCSPVYAAIVSSREFSYRQDIDRYSFSSGTMLSGVSIGINSAGQFGASNDVHGIFGGGSPTSDVLQYYAYATNTLSPAGNFLTYRYYNDATSSPDYAVFPGGQSSTQLATVEKRLWSSGTNTLTTSMSIGRAQLTATSNVHGGLTV